MIVSARVLQIMSWLAYAEKRVEVLREENEMIQAADHYFMQHDSRVNNNNGKHCKMKINLQAQPSLNINLH